MTKLNQQSDRGLLTGIPTLKRPECYQYTVSSGIIVPSEIWLPSLRHDRLPRTHSVTFDPSPIETPSNKIEWLIETPAPSLQLSPITKGPLSSTFSPITQPFPTMCVAIGITVESVFVGYYYDTLFSK